MDITTHKRSEAELLATRHGFAVEHALDTDGFIREIQSKFPDTVIDDSSRFLFYIKCKDKEDKAEYSQVLSSVKELVHKYRP